MKIVHISRAIGVNKHGIQKRRAKKIADLNASMIITYGKGRKINNPIDIVTGFLEFLCKN